MISPIYAQLELELAGPGLAWREPWEGQSPRELTRAAQTFSVGAPATGPLRANADGWPSDEELDEQARRSTHGA